MLTSNFFPLQIVGGTGITPAFQLLNTIFSTSSQALNTPTKSLPKFTILYGASKPSSFLLLPELATLQREFPNLIDIRLQVDQLDNTTTQKLTWMDRIRGKSPQLEGMDVRVGRINAQSVRSALESSDKDKTASRRILVCGPDGMIAYVAGSKQGQQQGKLGGVLAGLDCQEEEVWKL
jgi:ferredoxin-NADP reductase